MATRRCRCASPDPSNLTPGDVRHGVADGAHGALGVALACICVVWGAFIVLPERFGKKQCQRRRGHFIRGSRALLDRLGPAPQHAGLRAARLCSASTPRSAAAWSRRASRNSCSRARASRRAPIKTRDPRRVVRQFSCCRSRFRGPPAAREPRSSSRTSRSAAVY